MGVTGKRSAAFDNLRGLLMVLVVFGHLMETMSRDPIAEKHALYFLIYTFHMPAFLFLSGYFGRFSWKRVARLVVLYALFQAIYCGFSAWVLEKTIATPYTKPYWILWYLMVLIYDTCLIPVLDRIRGKWRWAAMAGLVALAVGVGHYEKIQYPWSLSRFFVFLPYFALGHWMGQGAGKERPRLWPVPGAIALMLTVGMYLDDTVTVKMLYGALPYYIDEGPLIRLIILVAGGCWTVALLGAAGTWLDREIPLLTGWGQRTLPIFLLHGFVVKWLDHREILGDSLWIPVLLTPVLLVLFGNPFVGRAFQWLLRKIDGIFPKAMV